MKEIIDNLIIKRDDPRYGKLGHLWKKYSFDSIWYSEGGRQSYYYIPPELVLNEYTYRDGRMIGKIPDDDWDNWVHCMKLGDLLYETCFLTTQEYFDLLVLHINSTLSRPRCAYCKANLSFNNVKVGYGGGGGNSEWTNKADPCCDRSCASKYRHQLGIYNDLYVKLNTDPFIRTKNEYYSLLGKGDDHSDCSLYVTWTSEGLLKFGATNDLKSRINHSYEDVERGYYLNPHVLVRSNRLEIANIEASLKLSLQGNEYLDPCDLHKLFKFLKSILSTRPVGNPFD